MKFGKKIIHYYLYCIVVCAQLRNAEKILMYLNTRVIKGYKRGRL